jgi:FkbM family methyltransferase
MTVYDIGANVGFFSLLASRLAGSGGIVYAFEPQPRNVRLLEFHRAANGITNLRILDAAVSARDGVAQFQSAKGPAMGSLAESGEYAVTTVTVDSFASDHRPPDVMKIDVEGAEVEVLTGATKTLLRHRPVIILSTHGWRLHQESLALLASLGYEHEMLRDGTRDGQYTVIAEGGRQRPGA